MAWEPRFMEVVFLYNARAREKDMQCPKCDSENPAGKKFCGDCGARLQATGYLSDEELQAKIRAAIKEELTDQRVVEVEITESVLDRITGWAKNLGFFAGIPLAALLLVLGLLGLKKYSDLWELASAAESKIGPVVERAQKTATEVDATTQRLQKQSGEVESQIATLKPRLESISKDAEKFSQMEKSFDGKFAGLQASLDQKINDVQGKVSEIEKIVNPPRWPVKTGQDPDKARVSTTPVITTVEELSKLTPPATDDLRSKGLQSSRIAPVELTVYTVEATILRGKLEADGDYELIIQGKTGATMIAESPTPTKMFVGNSPWFSEMATVRKQLDEEFVVAQGLKPRRGGGVHARITGVGFFDLVHGQTGVAPNGIELHPILRLEFLQ
jgi:hypothetical protein